MEIPDNKNKATTNDEENADYQSEGEVYGMLKS